MKPIDGTCIIRLMGRRWHNLTLALCVADVKKAFAVTHFTMSTE